MNKGQQHQAKKLIKSLCCNYRDGNCLLLDDGEPCVCVQSIAYSLCCNYFRVAVLPTEPVLEAEILTPAKLSACEFCKRLYVKNNYNQKYCKLCTKERHLIQQKRYLNKKYQDV